MNLVSLPVYVKLSHFFGFWFYLFLWFDVRSCVVSNPMYKGGDNR
jgi:hypothetical protein